MALKCFDLGNPNPTTIAKLPRTIPCFSFPESTSSHRLHNFRRIRSQTVFTTSFTYTPRGLSGSALLPVRNRCSFLQLAAPHDDSSINWSTYSYYVKFMSRVYGDQAPIDVEIKGMSEFEQWKQSDNEVWKQVLAAFIENTIKLSRISKEAFENHSRTAMVVLKKVAKDLKIEAAKASYDLSIIAQELGEEGRHYIALATENPPEPLKDIVETFKSCEKIKHASQFHEFYIGVPFGGILSVGGFIDFMITGRTDGIRFGVILGGTLLALSVSSLRSWRKGEQIDGSILKIETAIAGILFLRKFRLLFQKLSFPVLISSTITGAVAAFYIYKLIDAEESNTDIEPQT